MTTKESKFLALGFFSSLLLVVLVGAAYTAAQHHAATQKKGASAAAMPMPMPDADHGTQPGATVQLSDDEIAAAGVQTVKVKTAALDTEIAAVGRVDAPEAQLGAVSARISGRIDRLFVQYTGERVREGQPVAEIYSPEVATSLEELRLAEQNRASLRNSDDANARAAADALVAASRRKLELWGIAPKQVAAPIATSGIPHITLYANAHGVVMERKVTQGQYVNAGETLFTVADLSQVWIKADVYEEQLPLIRAGQAVAITADALPGQILHGRVDFIEPAANPQTRTVPVHIHLPNPGLKLMPGMFVTAQIKAGAMPPMPVIPRSSVIDTGTRTMVYLARTGGVFEAREVRLGAVSGDLYPVLSGIAAGDRVVTQGNFLIDSQTRLSGGMGGMYGGAKEFSSANASAGAQNKNSAQNTIELHAASGKFKVGEDNTVSVKLADAQGKSITDAQVTLTLEMPAMPSMNMPEMKSNVALAWSASAQAYVGKAQPGMMGGWNLFVVARRNGAVIATTKAHRNAE